MKKLTTILAALAISASVSSYADAVWCMPGSYQGWSLESNHFEEVDGVLTQTIADLTGQFKIIRYDDTTGASWDVAWGTNGNTIGNNEDYSSPRVGYESNIVLAGSNLHYVNATVTIIPGATDDDNITIHISAESVVSGDMLSGDWTMPGTYQGWSLQGDTFTADNGVLTLSIADLYGDFKIVHNVSGGSSWDIAWGTNGSDVENGVAYTAKKGGDNIYMSGSSDNIHYYNATVTIIPGSSDSDDITITVTAEKIAVPDDVWQLVGTDPGWTFDGTPEFTKSETDENVWVLVYSGTISNDFKIAKNKSWSACYSTAGTVELDQVYTLTGPADLGNMTPSESWENPTFTLTVKDDVVTLGVSLQAAGVEAISVDDSNAPAVYFNLQGQRVNNPENGIFIRLQGNNATKVAL